MNMKLKDLLADVEYLQIHWPENVCFDMDVSCVTCDSREVVPGALFVCIRGFLSDGHDYIEKATQAGAGFFVVEQMPVFPVSVVMIQVKDSRVALARISSAWYGYPASRMVMIGVTGTKGKTTSAHMIRKIFEEAGKKTGMIGTVGAYIGKEKIETKNTTPGPPELHRILLQMEKEGCSHVVMEVSSQGLKQHRTEGILFRYGIYLNISSDHIGPGEHADFREYLACKKLLFRQTECAVVNLEDAHADEILALSENKISFSLNKDSDYHAEDIQNIWQPGIIGVSFRLLGKDTADILLNMPGDFNVENALAAISIARAEGINMDTIQSALRQVRVKGRTQLVRETAHFTTVIIDYAHNALSMERLLRMLKSYHPRRLICLFGGGGNKPRQRRRDMGEAAGRYADLTIITMDNPRDEDMDEINRDIIKGLTIYGGAYMVIPDRKEAIHYLIDHSGKDDIIALIGKGHEEYQEVKGVKYFFSEEKIIREYLETK